MRAYVQQMAASVILIQVRTSFYKSPDNISGFIGLTCEEPYECVNGTSSYSTDKALVFGCNNELYAEIDITNQTKFGTIVLVNSVSMNITGTSVEQFGVAEFATESVTVELLQVSPPSKVVVDVGYDNNLVGNIQVLTFIEFNSHCPGAWNCSMDEWFD
jgi:hypothetical protein